jgi:hypothetical protein
MNNPRYSVKVDEEVIEDLSAEGIGLLVIERGLLEVTLDGEEETDVEEEEDTEEGTEEEESDTDVDEEETSEETPEESK